MNIAAFDLNLLRAFDALMETRNVSIAAAIMGLSQPAMSNRLTRLRRDCSDPLFVRTNKGMVPTPFAEELAPAVRQALVLLASALDGGHRFDPASSTRRFSLVLSDIGAVLYLPQLLATLSQLAPNVDLRVLHVPEDRILQVMEDMEADLTVGNPEFPSGALYQQTLFQYGHICLMRKGHPLAGRALTLDDYIAADHAVTRLPWGATYIERTLANMGIRRRSKIEVPTYLALISVVGCSDLIATIPALAVKLAPAPQQLATCELPFSIPFSQVKQHWHPRLHHDAGNRWLRTLFVQLFSGTSTREFASELAPSQFPSHQPTDHTSNNSDLGSADDLSPAS
jgi:DNA-binding transcriptional LysR family regulator